MPESPELRRGEWRIDEDDDRFILTIRPRIGAMSLLSAFYLVVFGGFGLLLVGLGLSSLIRGNLGSAALAVCLGLFPLLYAGFAWVGTYWLSWGRTCLKLEDGVVNVSFPGNRLARSIQLRPADLKTLKVDAGWVLYGMIYNLGHNPRRGPIVVSSWDGFTYRLGGNIPRQMAVAIVAAVQARIPASLGPSNQGIERTASGSINQ